MTLPNQLLINAGKVVTPRGVADRSAITVRDGRIHTVTKSPHQLGREPRGWLRADVVMPGFIDLHTHGYGGHAFGESAEAAREASQALAATGVTRCYATLGHGDSIAAIARTLATAAEAASNTTRGTRIEGLALEGPFIAAAKRGAWPEANLRPPSIPELRELIAAAGGALKRVNVAPELPGALDLTHFAVEQGLVVSIGHSDGTDADAHAAVRAGATITNHTYNGMSGLHHRAPGLVGETMANRALLAELILDGVHVHPAAARALFAAKGQSGVAIITDNVPAAGLPDGAYDREGREVTVEGAAVRLADGTLAGSASPFDRNLRNAAAWLRDDLRALAAMTSGNAAIAMGISDETGTIAPGHAADLTLLDSDLSVRATIVGGSIAFQRPERWSWHE